MRHNLSQLVTTAQLLSWILNCSRPTPFTRFTRFTTQMSDIILADLGARRSHQPVLPHYEGRAKRLRGTHVTPPSTVDSLCPPSSFTGELLQSIVHYIN
jgi:hypothetical protein